MLRPVDNVREYSLLSNPRTPKEVTSSVDSVTLKTSPDEIATLKQSSARVLNVTNLQSVDVLKDVLSTAQAKTFRQQFGSVGGSWCCAPTQDKNQGMPQSSYFRLMKADRRQRRGLGMLG